MACLRMTAILVLFLMTGASAVELSHTTHQFDGGETPAINIRNRFFEIEIVPLRGGRIARWVDLHDGVELVDLGKEVTAYGGLLDDHGARPVLPYVATILKNTPNQAVVQLAGIDKSGVTYIKTVTIDENRPVLVATYRFENRSSESVRLLMRNVIRPAGAPTTENDLYSYPTTHGIVHTLQGFGRTDNIGAPWMAYLNGPRRAGVATVVDGDVLRRLYTWRDSTVRPTYEFMLRAIEPGEAFETTVYWKIVRGMTAIDHATRDIDIASTRKGDGLHTLIAATWNDLADVTVQSRYLSPQRKQVGQWHQSTLGAIKVSSFAQTIAPAPPTVDDEYVILEQVVFENGNELARYEKPIALTVNTKFPGYTRQPVWHDQTTIETLEGFTPSAVINPVVDEAANERGYVVYEPWGQAAGRHLERIRLDLAINEPETFPLYIHALRDIGPTTISASPDANVEMFVGEEASIVNWGRTFTGWKLLPSTTLSVAPGQHSTVWVRMHSRDWTPGLRTVTVTVRPANAPAHQVAVEVMVAPVVVPERLLYSFDAHMLLNYLCSTRVGAQREWDMAKGAPYLKDLRAHGNNVFVSYGANALSGHHTAESNFLNRAVLRGTGQRLGQAIAENPTQFQDAHLPDLDLSYWNPLVDAAIEHGFTKYRTAFGGAETASNAFARMANLIWPNDDVAPGDPRQRRVARWAYRQISQYLFDRGYRMLLATIDDEIPVDKYNAWIEQSHFARDVGFIPGVTQSNELLHNEDYIKLMGPHINDWILGTMNKSLLLQRIDEGYMQPRRLITYDSSANYWRAYASERVSCGIQPGYHLLDGCWIQCYYRWNQAEAIIFPSEDGPISSAAWEGARDGLDDANLYILAHRMIEVLAKTDAARASEWRHRLDLIVGANKDAVLPVVLRSSRMGDLTVIEERDVQRMRDARGQLLKLITLLKDALPRPRLTLWYDQLKLVDRGEPRFYVDGDVRSQEQLLEQLRQLDPNLTATRGTHLRVALHRMDALPANDPAMAALTADLDGTYPGKGEYVIRQMHSENGEEVLAFIGADRDGLDKAIDHGAQFFDYDRHDYGQWFVEQ